MRRGDRGQAVVETALVLPLVVLFLLAVIQVGLVVRAQVLVTHAAREAARAAAVDPDPGAASRAAEGATSLDSHRLRVAVSGRDGTGSRVQVRVEYQAATDVPFVGALVGDVTIEAEATMRVE
ncbi:MAG: hypothetical protein QOH64_1104 [Acidimicrobiaceae bacterium]